MKPKIVIRLFCSTLVLCQKIKSLANYILWDGFFCSQIELVHLNITCVYATLNKIKYTQKTLILCTVLPYRICPALPSSWLKKGLFLKALCVHIIAHSYKSYFKPKQKYWPGLSATASCDAGDQCDSLDPIVSHIQSWVILLLHLPLLGLRNQVICMVGLTVLPVT